MLVHVDTESWQSEINLITLLSETENNLQETEKLSSRPLKSPFLRDIV